MGETAVKRGSDAFAEFVNSLANNIDPRVGQGETIWKAVSGPQKMALESLADETFYGGAAGGGKALKSNSIVYTSSGSKKICDIKVGDSVCTPDGGFAQVTKVHPQGLQKLYRICFDDGSAVSATGDHLWQIQIPSNGIKLMTTDELITYCRRVSSEDAYPYIPLAKMVNFQPGVALAVSAYVIGQMLGGETILMPMVTGMVGAREMRWGWEKRKRIFADTPENFDDPHIPWAYMLAGDQHRTDLISGILDKRAILTNEGLIAFTTQHLLLAQDLQWLARSLGLKARLQSGQTAHVVLIEAAHNRTYFKMHRLIETQALRVTKTLHGRRVVGIESDGEGDATCITIDHPDGLFLTNDFIVTHNCLTEDHLVMTRLRGWQPIHQTKEYDQVAAWDQDKIVWKNIVDRIAEPYSGQIYRYRSNKVSFIATPNHKVPVRHEDGRVEFEFVSQLNETHEFLVGLNGGFERYHPQSMNRVPYNGNVYCLTVDQLHNFVVKHDEQIHITGNSDLLLGWALTRALKSIIFRREYTQLKQIVDRSKEILRATSANYNGQEHTWTNIPGGRVLEFGSIPHVESVTKYMGRPHDFIGFDEISNFLYSQYIFLLTWNRTEVPGQRTRVICAGNPPTNTEGEWVVRRWAPWIDPGHGNPAAPGELRWFAMINDREEEVEDRTPIKVNSGSREEIIYPSSRTFIPASVEDNPYYGAEYKARLQSLPPELKHKFLYGDFGLSFQDNPWQVIPSAWVRMGRERYDQMKSEGKTVALENVNPSYGLDPSEAGKDFTALCKINVNVVQYILYSELSDSMKIADWVIANMIGQRGAPIAVDSNGVGAGIHYRLKQLGLRSYGMKVQSRTQLKDRTGNMMFLNLRAYMWWMVRDALDPNGPTLLALPPDIKLERELTAARWELTETGYVQVEKQDSIRERLGRSPDAANALMMALFVAQARRPAMRMV